LAVVVAVQGLAAPFLFIGLSREGPARHPALWRDALAFALGSLGLVLFLVLYQIGYRVKLPLPNSVLAPIAAFVLALGGRGFRGSGIPTPTARLSLLASVPLVLILVPLSMALARSPGADEEGNGRSLVLVSYNVHLAIDRDRQLNPEVIAEVIESETPDVVALQEVPRGWPGAGGLDLAEWLSRRLGMPYAYAPAADDQFGNLVLSRLPIRGSAGVLLPQRNSAMRRSYVRTVIDIGQGRSVTIFDAHLEGGQPDRRDQVIRLLRGWGTAPRTVISGLSPRRPGRSSQGTGPIGSSGGQTSPSPGFASGRTRPRITDRWRSP
jgi:hypothetical protein